MSVYVSDMFSIMVFCVCVCVCRVCVVYVCVCVCAPRAHVFVHYIALHTLTSDRFVFEEYPLGNTVMNEECSSLSA